MGRKKQDFSENEIHNFVISHGTSSNYFFNICYNYYLKLLALQVFTRINCNSKKRVEKKKKISIISSIFKIQNPIIFILNHFRNGCFFHISKLAVFNPRTTFCCLRRNELRFSTFFDTKFPTEALFLNNSKFGNICSSLCGSKLVQKYFCSQTNIQIISWWKTNLLFFLGFCLYQDRSLHKFGIKYG